MTTEERHITNLARLYLIDSKELVKTARYINVISIKGLSELRRLYKEIPSDMLPQEQYLKDMISATSVYLAETNNWYEKYRQEEETGEETIWEEDYKKSYPKEF
jgi:hypothetical protein